MRKIRFPLSATAWNNGRHHKSGAGYGLRIRKEDRGFFKRCKQVLLQLEDERTSFTVNISKSFRRSCPEIDTEEGKKAKQFVEKVLKGVPSLTVLSSKNPSFDRYEADVFLPGRSPSKDTMSSSPGVLIGDQVYLNNLLLEKGYAVRVRE